MKLTQLINENFVDLVVLEKDDEDKDIDRAPAPGSTGEYITTAQAAKMLGVSMSRIRQMVADGTLTSHNPTKGRRDHLLKRKSVQGIKTRGVKLGRPDEGKGDKAKEDQ